MTIQILLLGLFGLVMTLVGLLVGVISTILLLVYRRGVNNKKKSDS